MAKILYRTSRKTPRSKMTPVKKHFTLRFLNMFGVPDAFNPAEYAKEYEVALSGVDADILRIASMRIVQRHKYRNWPLIAECLEAVNEVAAELSEKRRARNAAIVEPEVPIDPEMKQRVAAMVAETSAKMKALADEEAKKKAEQQRLPPIQWTSVSRDEWADRLKSDAMAQWMSLPKWQREEQIANGTRSRTRDKN